MKPRVALYVGGMGARDHNFHKDAMVRRGYADAADRIQELFLAGRRDDSVERGARRVRRRRRAARIARTHREALRTVGRSAASRA